MVKIEEIDDEPPAPASASISTSNGSSSKPPTCSTPPGITNSSLEPNSSAADPVTPTFTFDVSSSPFTHMHSDAMRKNFEKWGITRSQVAKFRFNQLFLRAHADAFLSCFFNDRNVQQCIMVADKSGNSGKLSGIVRNIKYNVLLCTQLSLEFFDRFYQSGIAREEDQYITKCADQFLPNGVTVADKLRELFLCGEESEHYELYSEKEKKEFLYHIMWRIVAGGGLCQWEDEFTAYRDTCKEIYKDLVGIQKNPYTDDIETCSVIYQVTSIDANLPLFGRDAPNHNFCYVAVNPVRKEVAYWYSSFVSVW